MNISSSYSHWICNSCRATARRTSRATINRSAFQTTRNSSSSSTTTQTPPRRGRLPDFPARTRFAPSPTGNLHLGSIRTALFNYLLAKATNGQFLLRIEDTDAKRTIPGAEEKLYEDLRWAGLQWDEGPLVGGPYGPYRQSERLPFYRSHIQPLLDSDHAYRCFCTSERIDELNRHRHEKGLGLGYDRKCAHMSKAEAEERAHAGEVHVIRFRAPSVWPKYHDLVYGKSGHGEHRTKKLLVDEPVYEDSILMKSDGYPTYHWANICDDHDMQITHVVRGSEWMSSTPLHVALYHSLNWTPPAYAHVPLLVGQNGQKLSKRNLDSDVSSFRDRGFFPEALTNFAALLGWSHQEKKDFMDHQRLIELFDLKITRGNTIVSFGKLDHLQEMHAKRRIDAGGDNFEQMIRDVTIALLQKYGSEKLLFLTGNRPVRDVLASMLRIKSLPYISATGHADQLSIFFNDPPQPLPDFPIPNDLHLLHYLRVAATALTLVPEEHWTEPMLRESLMALEKPPVETIATTPWKVLLYHYLRQALLWRSTGPAISHCMEVLGRDVCVARIQRANLQSREMETRRIQPTLDQQSWKGDADGKRRVEKDYSWKEYTLQEEQKK
jgi:glutamyl-tRNA synthetase